MTAHSLKTRRKKLQLTQYALAKSARVSRWTVASFEVGYRELTDDEALRINNALIKKEASRVTNKEVQPQ